MKQRTKPPLRRRRWFQFSVGSLLLLTLAVAAFLGWVRAQQQYYADRLAALTRISELGGTYAAHERGPAWKRLLFGAGFNEIETIDLSARWGGQDSSGVRAALGTIQLTSEDVALLGRFPELRRLLLDNRPEITSADIKNLAGLKNLRELALFGTRIDDGAMDVIGGMSHLERLDISWTKVGHKGLVQIESLRSLRFLGLLVTEAHGHVRIKNLPALEEIRGLPLCHCGIELSDLPNLKKVPPDIEVGATADGCVFRNLPKVPYLRVHVMREQRMDYAPTVILENLPQLKHLRIQGATVEFLTNGGAIDHVVAASQANSFSRLDSVALFDAPIRSVTLETWPRLESLQLSSTDVDDESLASLVFRKRLEYLNLSFTNVSDQGIRDLHLLRNLKALDLSRTRIGDNGVREIARLPFIERLDLSNTRVSDEGLRHLCNLTSLEELILDKRLPYIGVVPLRPCDEARLQRLDHSHLPQITDAGLAHLSGLNNLRMLDLSGTNVTLDGISRLRTLSNLAVLDVQGTRATDEATLAAVRNWPTLVRVALPSGKTIFVQRLGDR